MGLSFFFFFVDSVQTSSLVLPSCGVVIRNYSAPLQKDINLTESWEERLSGDLVNTLDLFRKFM